MFTACFSRLMFVYLTFSMTLEEVIAGCGAEVNRVRQALPARRQAGLRMTCP